jgi:hypothetical protein
MIFFVAVSRKEIGATGGAVERDLAFGAAADGADFFGFCGAEAFGFTFLADGTGQEELSGFEPAIKLPRENSKTPVSEGGRYKDEYIAGENITP